MHAMLHAEIGNVVLTYHTNLLSHFFFPSFFLSWSFFLFQTYNRGAALNKSQLLLSGLSEQPSIDLTKISVLQVTDSERKIVYNKFRYLKADLKKAANTEAGRTSATNRTAECVLELHNWHVARPVFIVSMFMFI